MPVVTLDEGEQLFKHIITFGTGADLLALIDELNHAVEGINEQIKLARNRLLEIHTTTGELYVRGNGFVSTLKEVPISVSFLKSEYGLKDIDFPDNVWEEKITKVLNKEAIVEHLKSKNIEVEPRMGIAIFRQAVEKA